MGMSYLENKILNISGCIIDPRPKSHPVPGPLLDSGLDAVAALMHRLPEGPGDLLVTLSQETRSTLNLEFVGDKDMHVGPYEKNNAVALDATNAKIKIELRGGDLYAVVTAGAGGIIGPYPEFKLRSKDSTDGPHPGKPALKRLADIEVNSRPVRSVAVLFNALGASTGVSLHGDHLELDPHWLTGESAVSGARIAHIRSAPTGKEFYPLLDYLPISAATQELAVFVFMAPEPFELGGFRSPKRWIFLQQDQPHIIILRRVHGQERVELIHYPTGATLSPTDHRGSPLDGGKFGLAHARYIGQRIDGKRTLNMVSVEIEMSGVVTGFTLAAPYLKTAPRWTMDS